MLRANKIAHELERTDTDDPLIIVPKPRVACLRETSTASVDLRLGRWFLVKRQSKLKSFDVYADDETIPNESKLVKTVYIPFGGEFILHPRSFVLGVTLEWIRIPLRFTAFVVDKSSWGRHGLIIATANGVHSGFTGCLTLEITNLGEVPISIRPGMAICQLFLQEVADCSEHPARNGGHFSGSRKPRLKCVKLDDIAVKLADPLKQGRIWRG